MHIFKGDVLFPPPSAIGREILAIYPPKLHHWFRFSVALAVASVGSRRRTAADKSTSEAASNTASFSKNCPGAAEIAGNPPAVCSATPGVDRKNVNVIAKVADDMAAPIAEKSGANAPMIRAAAVASSIVPMKWLAPCTPNIE